LGWRREEVERFVALPLWSRKELDNYKNATALHGLTVVAGMVNRELNPCRNLTRWKRLALP
jgi:hypothetical protein